MCLISQGCPILLPKHGSGRGDLPVPTRWYPHKSGGEVHTPVRVTFHPGETLPYKTSEEEIFTDILLRFCVKKQGSGAINFVAEPSSRWLL